MDNDENDSSSWEKTPTTSSGSTRTTSSADPLPTFTAASTALTATSEQELRVPCYCEENVWRLAYRKLNRPNNNNTNNKSHYFVVFVSNPSKCVCFFHQRASHHRTKPVFWDYHVLLLERQLQEEGGGGSCWIWDMDSYLPYPCLLQEYLENTFPSLEDMCPPPPAVDANNNTPPEIIEQVRRQQMQQAEAQLTSISPIFRLIPAATFLSHFSSDRSHMWDAVKKQWSAPPPTYPCIFASSSASSGNGNGSNNHHDSHHNDEGDTTTNHGTTTTHTTSSNLMTYVEMAQPQIHNGESSADNKDDGQRDGIFGRVLTRGQLQARFLT